MHQFEPKTWLNNQNFTFEGTGARQHFECEQKRLSPPVGLTDGEPAMLKFIISKTHAVN